MSGRSWGPRSAHSRSLPHLGQYWHRVLQDLHTCTMGQAKSRSGELTRLRLQPCSDPRPSSWASQRWLPQAFNTVFLGEPLNIKGGRVPVNHPPAGDQHTFPAASLLAQLLQAENLCKPDAPHQATEMTFCARATWSLRGHEPGRTRTVCSCTHAWQARALMQARQT